jgi:hypothetical protein
MVLFSVQLIAMKLGISVHSLPRPERSTNRIR